MSKMALQQSYQANPSHDRFTTPPEKVGIAPNTLLPSPEFHRFVDANRLPVKSEATSEPEYEPLMSDDQHHETLSDMIGKYNDLTGNYNDLSGRYIELSKEHDAVLAKLWTMSQENQDLKQNCSHWYNVYTLSHQKAEMTKVCLDKVVAAKRMFVEALQPLEPSNS